MLANRGVSKLQGEEQHLKQYTYATPSNGEIQAVNNDGAASEGSLAASSTLTANAYPLHLCVYRPQLQRVVSVSASVVPASAAYEGE